MREPYTSAVGIKVVAASRTLETTCIDHCCNHRRQPDDKTNQEGKAELPTMGSVRVDHRSSKEHDAAENCDAAETNADGHQFPPRFIPPRLGITLFVGHAAFCIAPNLLYHMDRASGTGDDSSWGTFEGVNWGAAELSADLKI
jgi:hypothetical protein